MTFDADLNHQFHYNMRLSADITDSRLDKRECLREFSAFE